MLSELTTITANWLFIRPEAVVEQSADAVIARTGFFVLSSVFKERPGRGKPSPFCGARPELDLLMPRRQPKFRAEVASPTCLPRRSERAGV